MCLIISTFAKCLLCFFNVLVLVCGILLIVLGALLFTTVTVLPMMSPFQSIIVMILGAAVAVISIIGCCGACSRISCVLCIYAFFMIVLGIAQMALGITILVTVRANEEKFDKTIRDAAKDIFDQYLYFETESASKGVSLATAMDTVNDFQDDYECCGLTGATDYTTSSKPIPDGCCENKPCNENNSYKGCSELFGDTVKTYFMYLAGICLGFALFEFLCAILACCLRKKAGGQQNHPNENYQPRRTVSQPN